MVADYKTELAKEKSNGPKLNDIFYEVVGAPVWSYRL
jgi:hypothetical protein